MLASSSLLVAAAAPFRVQLHVHLDGAVTSQTLFDLAQQRNLSLPVVGVPAAVWQVELLLALNPGFGAFDVINGIIGGNENAIALVAERFVGAQAADGVAYAEVRYDPLRLSASSYANESISPRRAVAAVAAGLRRGMRNHNGTRVYALLCAMRGEPAACMEVAELASSARAAEGAGFGLPPPPGGVVGIDLAGDEWESNNSAYVACFRRAKLELGLNTTVHAGETLPWPLSWERWSNPHTGADVYTAATEMLADRIGHGYAAAANATTLQLLRARNVHLEACPTTAEGEGAIRDIKAFKDANVSFGINTDDPCLGCSGAPRSIGADEDLVRTRLGFSDADIQAAYDEAAAHIFGTLAPRPPLAGPRARLR